MTKSVNIPVTDHPDDRSLQAYAEGKLEEGACLTIQAHLNDCPACCDRMDNIPQGTVWQNLRRPEEIYSLPIELANHPRYKVEAFLGTGGMGCVYRAVQVGLNRTVAIKMIRSDLVGSTEALERFRREAEAVALLDHPNIVRIYEIDNAGRSPILIMQYIDGHSLANKLQSQRPFGLMEACDYAYQTALGLQHAYENDLVHRDIKPDNLLLSSKGIVKIVDFGLARLESDLSGNRLTQDNSTMGTYHYMAPEQAKNAHEAGIRADIYSLGCTLYHLLANHPPFQVDSVPELLEAHRTKHPVPIHLVRSDIPQTLSHVLDRMMAKDPNKRFSTPAEVAAALLPYVQPSKPNSPYSGKPSTNRSSQALVILACSLLGLALLFGLGMVFLDPDVLWDLFRSESVNERLTREAFLAFEAGDYELAWSKTDECVREFGRQAKRQQQQRQEENGEEPPLGRVSRADKRRILDAGLLNDVASCLWIQGRCALLRGDLARARQAFDQAKLLTYARCFDRKQNLFWSQSQKAKDELDNINDLFIRDLHAFINWLLSLFNPMSQGWFGI